MKYGETIQVRLTPELEQAVNQYANDNEISISDVVRMSLRRWLIPALPTAPYQPQNKTKSAPKRKAAA